MKTMENMCVATCENLDWYINMGNSQLKFNMNSNNGKKRRKRKN